MAYSGFSLTSGIGVCKGSGLLRGEIEEVLFFPPGLKKKWPSFGLKSSAKAYISTSDIND